MDGGTWVDAASYSDLASAVTVNLATSSTGGAAGTDVLTSIEDVTGTNSADTLRGNGSANRIYGLKGSDRLYGMGGNDHLDGGAGTDSLDGGLGTDTCVNGETKVSCEA